MKPTVGPGTWPDNFENCALTHQSPIDITDDSLVYDSELAEIMFKGYDTVPEAAELTLSNTGHTGTWK